jgi:hypothetical protein
MAILILAVAVAVVAIVWRSVSTVFNRADERQQTRPNQPSSRTPPKTRPTSPPPPSLNAGWYKDPFGTGRRYWDGGAWTEQTAV